MGNSKYTYWPALPQRTNSNSA
uniref:Uncharacterized protein n=1 Tax=Anguilla anguilla TaxID=7936 RepID=A0A0E9TE56_ANGAN